MFKPSMTLRVNPRLPPDLGKAETEVMREGVMAGLKLGLQYLAGAVREKIAKGPLHSRTGALERSWVPLPIEEVEGGARVGVGSKSVYAAIHEFGGTIVPVKAKALTIPIKGTNMTPAGVPRFPSVASLKAAMGAKNVFLMKRAGKPPLIAAHQGKGAPIPYFTLAKQSVIHATNYVTLAKAAAEPKVLKAMEVSMKRAAERARQGAK